MEIKFELNRESFVKSIKALFLSSYKKIVLAGIGFAVVLTFFSSISNHIYDLKNIIITAFLLFIVVHIFMISIVILKNYRNIKEGLQKIGSQSFFQSYTLNDDGIFINSLKTNRLFNWVDIKSAFVRKTYVFITLRNRLTYSIPKSAFESQEQIELFVNTIRGRANKSKMKI